jgi:hypothetical protein
LGGNVRVEAPCEYTTVGKQSRFLGELIDEGMFTVDHSTPGRMLARAARYNRLLIDGQGAGGARIGSDDNLLRLYGLKSFGTGTTLANNFAGSVDISGGVNATRVTFPTPEVDHGYFPIVTLQDLTGGSASKGFNVANLSPDGFDVILDAPPGDRRSIRANYVIVRIS